jgi:hypothetical protein
LKTFGNDAAFAGVTPAPATPFLREAEAGGFCQREAMHMRRLMLGALGATTMLWSIPATGQELPLKSGNFWDVGAVTIDDGHFAQYADYLATQYRKNMEFQKSKGWIKDYHIFANVNKRAGEPDLYLVTVFDHVTTPAEDIQREKEINAFLAQNTREQIAGSGQRATYRHLGSDMLLQEMTWSH